MNFFSKYASSTDTFFGGQTIKAKSLEKKSNKKFSNFPQIFVPILKDFLGTDYQTLELSIECKRQKIYELNLKTYVS